MPTRSSSTAHKLLVHVHAARLIPRPLPLASFSEKEKIWAEAWGHGYVHSHYCGYPRSQAHTRNAEVGLVTLGKIPVCAELSSLDFG